MALSGSKKGTVTKNSSHYEYWMEWSATQDITSNTSTITVKHYWKKIGSKTFDSTAARNYGITIDGKSFTGSKRMDYSPWVDKNISTETHTVKHNDDGTKTLTISTYANGRAGDYGPSSDSGTSGDCTASVEITLDQIPRAAQLLSAENFTDESNPTITYSNPAGSAANVQVGIFDTDGMTSYVGYRSISQTGTSYTFPLTDAEKKTLIEAVPSGSKEMYVRIYMKTYIGGKLVGDLVSLQRIFTVVKTTPTWTYSASDTGTVSTQLTNDPNTMIKGYNVVVASMTPSLKKYATIKSQTITNGGKTVSGSSATFEDTENNTFRFRMTDSFGNTLDETKTLKMVEYTKLTCNVSTSNPTIDGKVSVKIFGNYFDDKFGTKGDQNTLTLKYRIKENNGSYGGWTPVTTSPTITNNTYTVTIPMTMDKPQSTYTIQAMAIDLMNTNGVTSTERSFKTTPVFNWGKDNFDINVPLNVNNGMILEATTLEAGINLGDITSPGFYKGYDASEVSYTQSPLIRGAFSLEVSKDANGQLRQVLTKHRSNSDRYMISAARFERFYHSDDSAKWYVWDVTGASYFYNPDGASGWYRLLRISGSGGYADVSGTILIKGGGTTPGIFGLIGIGSYHNGVPQVRIISGNFKKENIKIVQNLDNTIDLYVNVWTTYTPMHARIVHLKLPTNISIDIEPVFTGDNFPTDGTIRTSAPISVGCGRNVILYENSSGSNGTITLTDNVANYSSIEICGKNGNQEFITNRFNIRSTSAELQISYNTNGNGIVYPGGTVYTISNNILYMSYTYRIGIYGGNLGYESHDNIFSITKVIGYE